MTRVQVSIAREAIEQLVTAHLEPADELFLMEFWATSLVLQEWTTDRLDFRGGLQALRRPTGVTAMYDAIARGVGLAQTGRFGKRALLVLSDGNDTRSVRSTPELRDEVLQTDVIVYALGVDGGGSVARGDRFAAATLRQVTDPTGGRTEVVDGFEQLEEALARLADELRGQYQLGYVSPTRDVGVWHEISVEVAGRGRQVLARRGYQR
jgi:Ca-activated chloride channel family protein